jgi:hypothetical protein
MKRVQFFLSVFLFVATVQCQNFKKVDTDPNSPNFEYFGCMFPGLLMRLNEEERNTFNYCLKYSGYTLDSLDCINRDFIRKYVGEKIDYSEIVLKKHTYQNFFAGESKHEGKAKLNKPMIFVYIKRHQEYSTLTVQIYY